MPAIFLERRRDQLNPKTMLYEYVEVAALRGIFGDIFVSQFLVYFISISFLGM
jgi:hypothetical protein